MFNNFSYRYRYAEHMQALPQKAHRYYRKKRWKNSNLKYFQLYSYLLSNLFISFLGRF